MRRINLLLCSIFFFGCYQPTTWGWRNLAELNTQLAAEGVKDQQYHFTTPPRWTVKLTLNREQTHTYCAVSRVTWAWDDLPRYNYGIELRSEVKVLLFPTFESFDKVTWQATPWNENLSNFLNNACYDMEDHAELVLWVLGILQILLAVGLLGFIIFMWRKK